MEPSELLIFEISNLKGCLYTQGAYTCGGLLFAIHKNHRALLACVVLADFYTTGMTVMLMGFAF